MTVIVMEEGKEKSKATATATAAVSEASGRPLMHNQVRRLREEELWIAGEGRWSNRDLVTLLHLSTHVDATLCSRSRPILPSSPLGNKAAIGSSVF